MVTGVLSVVTVGEAGLSTTRILSPDLARKTDEVATWLTSATAL